MTVLLQLQTERVEPTAAQLATSQPLVPFRTATITNLQAVLRWHRKNERGGRDFMMIVRRSPVK
jgi:hypothetical protein